MSTSRPRIALVLSGGAARGAYEAGVVAYLCDGLVRDTGVRARFDVLCGSSVGALNACFLAATMDQPEAQGALLVERWSSLELDELLRLRSADMVRFGRALFGAAPRGADAHRHGGVIDPTTLERVVLAGAPWEAVSRNIAAGRLSALAVSATHVASGHTVVFVEKDAGAPFGGWGSDPFVHAVPARIRPAHALASAAIPIVFPAVAIGGEYFCDGALRLNTPLSPALRLGAERVLVVSLRYRPAHSLPPPFGPLDAEPSGPAPGPYFLAGKVINALWLDHVDYDLDRMRRTNAVLAAGEHAFGADFAARLNEALGAAGAAPLRSIDEVHVQPSRDIGALAAEYARGAEFAQRGRGIAAGLLRRMAAGAESSDDADLVSYLMFDGPYCQQLIELGESDARARRNQLARFFDGG